MTDLFSILAGGLSVLNGILSLVQKVLELLDRFKPRKGDKNHGKKGKNKRSTRKDPNKNP